MLPEKIKVFVAYTREDEDLRLELDKHLSLLQKQGQIQEWHDRDIGIEADWKSEVDGYVDGAQMILFLVSAHFLASEYCYGAEMERALQKHRDGSARVIPIILRPVDWQGVPFSYLQAWPVINKPVSSWEGRDGQDKAFSSISSSIRNMVKELAIQDQKESFTSPLRSVDGSTPTHITFSNATEGNVDIYWLDYTGNEVFYSHLEPGQVYAAQTYVSHPWRVKDKEGQILQECIATKDPQHITLQ